MASSPLDQDAVHIMLDLETLGTSQDSVVTEIGTAIYDGSNEFKMFFAPLYIEEQTKRGRKTCKETLQWHFENNAENFTRYIDGYKAPIEDALNELNRVIDSIESNKIYLWANSPDFDVSILKNLFANFDMALSEKIRYNNILDFRTMRIMLSKDIVKTFYQESQEEIEAMDIPSKGKHNALADAILQLKVLLRMLGKNNNEVITDASNGTA